MSSPIDYDCEEVMDFCAGEAQTGIHNLASHLNDLTNLLEDCQDSFHCKGGDTENAVNKIYRGFSAAIGHSYGSMSGSGLGACVAGAATVVNLSYEEAKKDFEIQKNDEYITNY